MPTPPGYGDVSVAMKHTLLSRMAFITFGVDPTSLDPVTVGSLVAGCITGAGSLGAQLDSNVTWAYVKVRLGTDGAEDLAGVHTMNVIGGKTNSTPPPNTALLVHKYTSRGGRRGRGRLFIPWFVSSAEVAEGGTISSSEVTLKQTAVTNFLTALSAANVPMALLHRASEPWDPIKETGVENPTVPGPPNLVTSLVVDPLISTQRRRLGR